MADEPTISPEYAAELGRQVDELEAENERLRKLLRRKQSARERALERAARDFITKVDRGEVRSVKSYAALKAALEVGNE